MEIVQKVWTFVCPKCGWESPFAFYGEKYSPTPHCRSCNTRTKASFYGFHDPEKQATENRRMFSKEERPELV